ncbi:NAD(+)--rifampin ADP-ribosyltransferase [Fulvivirga sp.]|uniref:NAD(+)--rifampin ADP-ribosyltransferase n=1 Tax=Fulvivirga sp. TaxID=1931237 RepID=UPI0032EAC4B5
MATSFQAGYNSNYGQGKMQDTFSSPTLGAVIWGAELAFGKGKERINLVEPTGFIRSFCYA